MDYGNAYFRHICTVIKIASERVPAKHTGQTNNYKRQAKVRNIMKM